MMENIKIGIGVGTIGVIAIGLLLWAIAASAMAYSLFT
jgi:hypothetical protein